MGIPGLAEPLRGGGCDVYHCSNAEREPMLLAVVGVGFVE